MREEAAPTQNGVYEAKFYRDSYRKFLAIEGHFQTCSACRDEMEKNGVPIQEMIHSIHNVQLGLMGMKDNHREGFLQEINRTIAYLQISPRVLFRIFLQSLKKKIRWTKVYATAWGIVLAKIMRAFPT